MTTLPSLVALAALAFPASPAAPLVQDEVLTPRRVASLEQVVSAAISPDGRHAAYVVAVPREPGVDDDGPSWTELHVADLAGGGTRPFVTGHGNVSGVAWTPSGDGIAFRAKRDGDESTCLYVIPVDGGEARRVLALEASIQDYDFAPDGRRVVAIASAPEDEAREKLAKQGFAQEIYEEDWDHARLWIAPIDRGDSGGAGEPRRLEFDGEPHAVHWSPVDDRLLVAWTPTPLIDDTYVRQRVAVLDGASGEVLARIENPGKLGEIGWSPDGKRVALIAAEDAHDPNAGRMMLAPASGGTPVDLLPGLEGDAEDFAWPAPDALLVVVARGVETTLERLSLAPDGAAASEVKELVPAGGRVLHSIDLAADGQAAVLVADAPGHPNELFHMALGGGAPRRLTDSNPWLAEVRLAEQEVVEFQARDGLGLQGLLIRPLDEAEGRRYPLILYVHGGPESHHSNGWLTSYSSPGQVAAARGFAVFFTNYRGSTGRGVAFSKLSQGDPAGKEFDDLVDAVDHLVALGLVDADKVGVTGGSYGGYATGWCSTALSERFAAGVMFVGISDKVSKVGTTDIPDEEYMVHALMRPWEDWSFLLERSPITHAGESKTPLLILHGKDDPRVNVGQSRELYRHLSLRGEAPVRLVLYPGEGHGNRKAAARYDYSLRSLRWFEHYLKGPGGEKPPYEIDYELDAAPQAGS